MQGNGIRKYEKDGLIHLLLENEFIRSEFLPEIGGKMIALIYKKTGRQYLLEPQNSGGAYRHAGHGANFEEFDTSGFDECFPTIAASEHPLLKNGNNGTHLSFPDHGELWSMPWGYDLTGDGISMAIDGVNFQYRLEKHIALRENHLIINYNLTNLSEHSFSYLWSAHPLLKVAPGAQLILGDRVESVFLNWGSDKSLGEFGANLDWPHLSNVNKNVDYSVVQQRQFGEAIKCFTGKLTKGYAGIYHTDTDESMFFHFDTKQNPYLGIWLCYGGWPVESPEKHLTVALEPASGRPDSLNEAILRNEYSEIGAGAQKTWQLKISLWKGRPDLLIGA